MKFTVAIQPDNLGVEIAGYHDNFSACWIDTLERLGHSAKIVDVWRSDILEQLDSCQGLMWRWAHCKKHMQLSRRLLPAIENYLGLPIFPNENTAWHYDDKIAQALIFKALRIPHPETFLFYDYDEALAWAEGHSPYPVVLKLASGAGSTNVKLISSRDEAKAWIRLLFEKGVRSFAENISLAGRMKETMRFAKQTLLTGRAALSLDVHKEYALFQKFLPGNAFDTRVTVIGNRAFAYRRSNRPNDFRASGSGIIDWNPSAIDEQFIRLAFYSVQRMKMQSCAIDGLYDDGRPVVGEVSYTYVHHLVHKCPGHWALEGNPQDGEIKWEEGRMWPGEAHALDFLELLAR